LIVRPRNPLIKWNQPLILAGIERMVNGRGNECLKTWKTTLAKGVREEIHALTFDNPPAKHVFGRELILTTSGLRKDTDNSGTSPPRYARSETSTPEQTTG
jgi:hypothetical protein